MTDDPVTEPEAGPVPVSGGRTTSVANEASVIVP